MHAVVFSLHTSPAAQPGAGDAGGMNVYVSHTVAMLVRAGHTVDVVTCDPTQTGPAVLPSGVTVHHVPTGARTKDEMGARAESIARTLLADPQLGPLVRAADLLWAHYWVSGLAACELRALLRAENAAHVPALAVSFHTLAAVKDRDLGEAREPQARRDAEVRIAAEADLVLANSPTEAADAQHLLGADPAHTVVAPPGIDTATFRPGALQEARRALGVEDADLLVLCVGRMQHVKGTDVLIAALDELARTEPALASRVRAVFLGDASGETDPSGLREAARTSAAASLIEFRAPVPADRVAQWYRAADLVAVPSRSESFGLVAAEAQAAGSPVLASAVGGLTHVTGQGRGGILVDGDDPVVWAHALAGLLGDPALRARLSTSGAEHAVELGWDRAERGMLAALEALTTETGGPQAQGTADGAAASPASVIALVRAWAAENEVEVESVAAEQIVVVLPGERKLKTNVSIRAGRHAVDLQAFVVRRPDENRERFFRWMLQQNGRLPGLSFSVDGYDDVYLNASLPPEVFAGAHAEEVLDSYLGRFLTVADSSFNELLVLGFLTSMKREWAWRLARGESTRNLEAFRHLLDTEDNEFIGTFTPLEGEG
ncbi:glycosyltransferase [Brevibacterium album]|uniref:glycosyltransferase n=1 Tax=Brevibacterium album TaxID=417948 RepID=UPI00040DEF9F|nr:glycosyltransferase [Brevibacterium album]